MSAYREEYEEWANETPSHEGPPLSVSALENTETFKAYNQAVEDAIAAIRGEKVDDPYAAATFINAIARKCSPHRYAAKSAEDSKR